MSTFLNLGSLYPNKRKKLIIHLTSCKYVVYSIVFVCNCIELENTEFWNILFHVLHPFIPIILLYDNNNIGKLLRILTD